MTDNNKMRLVFAPGCFDQFEGTQEELDELIEEIRETFESGEFLDKMVPVDPDEDADLIDFIESVTVDSIEYRNRTLH